MLDSWVCSMGWLDSKEGSLFAVPGAVLCLEGRHHTIPEGLCSVGCDRRRQGQSRGQGQEETGDKAQTETPTFHRDLEEPRLLEVHGNSGGQ